MSYTVIVFIHVLCSYLARRSKCHKIKPSDLILLSLDSSDVGIVSDVFDDSEDDRDYERVHPYFTKDIPNSWLSVIVVNWSFKQVC